MNRAQKNNNPGNLKYAGQREAMGKDDKGLAIFPDAPSGWRALIAQIRLDQRRGLTVEEFINKYAPPSENDTQAYGSFILDHMNTYWGDSLSNLSPYALAGVIAQYEGYFNKT